MKKIRNFFSLFLSLVMVLTMIPFTNMQRVYADNNDLITDPALKKAINKSLSDPDGLTERPADQNITREDIDKIEVLPITEPINDWQKLREMPKLSHLYIKNLKEFDFKNISELTLQVLVINGATRFDEDVSTSLKNIDSLQNLKILKNLIMNNCNLTDSDAQIISNLQNLRILSLQKNNITNISVFLELKNLEMLDLSGNKIKDISSLGNVPADNPLTKINLSNNNIANHRIPDTANKFRGDVILLDQTINVSTDSMLMVNPLIAPDDTMQKNMEVEEGRVELQGPDNKIIKILDFDNLPNNTTTAILSYDNGAYKRVKANLTIKKISNTEHNIKIEKTYKAQIINGKIIKIDNNDITPTDMQNIKKGAVVNITADEISGKTFQKWQVNSGNAGITDNKDKSTAFVMPENDVTIEAIYEDVSKTTPTPKSSTGGGGGGGGASTPTKRGISTDSSSTKNGTISIDKDKAESNQKITITTTPDKGYETKNVIVKTISGREIKVTKNSDNSYSFEMPMEEVKISAEFVKKEEQKKVETKKETEKPKQVVLLKIGSKEMSKTLDGKTSKIQSDVAPFIKGGRTMMPLRYVAEALGLEVKWDNATKTAILRDGKKEIRVPVYTNQIIVDGKVYISDVPPVINKSRTYLSISNLAKALGLAEGVDIIWNGKTKEVTISKPLSK